MMGRSLIVICLLFVGNLACAETVFYLHGRIIEVEGVQPTHQRFGLYDYLGTVDALKANGATVIADVRTGNTNVLEYARGVVDQIEDLIESGEPPNNITVVGFSKGGAIAIFVSSLLSHPEVKFVFLASCGKWISSRPELVVSGNIFSIYEDSDAIAGSCKELVRRNDEISSFRELKLSTGKEHGAFYLPRAVWVEPLLAWVDEGYE
jgi:hypothetical protein